ncbi:MAG: hypothetical protein OEQ18_17790 [Gammaproteobacteria bacterium]|nr:hypothetical protein [Gammaproteobacteria bacterium]
MKLLRCFLLCLGTLAITTASGQPAGVADFSGLYRPAGLAVQPCGRNEWMRRSFETDTFCLGSDDGFPFRPEGMERWKSFSPIDDPVLGCIENFPRNAMRGRPMRITLGEEVTEIAYWFNREWFVRTVHMNGTPPPANTPHTAAGYSIGHWVGDSLLVETTHTEGGPMFNDHKPNSSSARITERFWRAPDGQNLLMDITLDDPEIYTKPFLLNRQEWIWSPDATLSQEPCEPSSIWERRFRNRTEQ